MAGGCWVCNPLCGKCQPAPKKSSICPTCGTCTIFDRKDIIANSPLLCRSCHQNLAMLVKPLTTHCSYSGLMCAYPCGKSTSSLNGRDYQLCKRNTPPQDPIS